MNFAENDFDKLSTKFSHLLYSRKEGDGKLINNILDELNKLNYKYVIVTNTTVRMRIRKRNCINHNAVNISESCAVGESMLYVDPDG